MYNTLSRSHQQCQQTKWASCHTHLNLVWHVRPAQHTCCPRCNTNLNAGVRWPGPCKPCVPQAGMPAVMPAGQLGRKTPAAVTGWGGSLFTSPNRGCMAMPPGDCVHIMAGGCALRHGRLLACWILHHSCAHHAQYVHTHTTQVRMHRPATATHNSLQPICCTSQQSTQIRGAAHVLDYDVCLTPV